MYFSCMIKCFSLKHFTKIQKIFKKDLNKNIDMIFICDMYDMEIA